MEIAIFDCRTTPEEVSVSDFSGARARAQGWCVLGAALPDAETLGEGSGRLGLNFASTYMVPWETSKLKERQAAKRPVFLFVLGCKLDAAWTCGAVTSTHGKMFKVF